MDASANRGADDTAGRELSAASERMTPKEVTAGLVAFISTLLLGGTVLYAFLQASVAAPGRPEVRAIDFLLRSMAYLVVQGVVASRLVKALVRVQNFVQVVNVALYLGTGVLAFAVFAFVSTAG